MRFSGTELQVIIKQSSWRGQKVYLLGGFIPYDDGRLCSAQIIFAKFDPFGGGTSVFVKGIGRATEVGFEIGIIGGATWVVVVVLSQFVNRSPPGEI